MSRWKDGEGTISAGWQVCFGTLDAGLTSRLVYVAAKCGANSKCQRFLGFLKQV